MAEISFDSVPIQLSRIVKNEEKSDVAVKDALTDILDKPSQPVTTKQTHNFYSSYKDIHRIKQKDDLDSFDLKLSNSKKKNNTKPVQDSSFFNTPNKKKKPQTRDKSPIIEYLKQVDKDK